jgi:hypothetical protein
MNPIRLVRCAVSRRVNVFTELVLGCEIEKVTSLNQKMYQVKLKSYLKN